MSDAEQSVCLSDDDVLAFFDGRLGERLPAVEQHVQRCSNCRELLISAGAAMAPTATPQSSETTPKPVPLPTFERYQAQSLVGQGGMGTVYAAHDSTLGRKVALKVLHAQVVETAFAGELSARLEQEARVMAQFSHPNVLPVFDLGTVDGRVFVAMELVDGWTLRRWLALEPRSWRAVLEVYLAAGEGLAAAHRAKLIHRDFKPENVLVGKDGRVRVTDFGLARAQHELNAARGMTPQVGADTKTLSPLSNRLTQPGALVGTPQYMSPEQLRGEALDSRSDLFSFCASLYESLTGQGPFVADTPEEQLAATAAGRFPKQSQKKVPRWLLAHLEKGLSADPSARPSSLEVLLADLRRGLSRRKLRFSVATAALTLLAGSVGGWIFSHRENIPMVHSQAGAPRLAYAVLPPQNRTQAPELAWLSPAFTELVGGELALGDQLRRIDNERVARAVAAVRGNPAEQLPALRAQVDADWGVVSAFSRVGTEGLKLELTVEDLRTGKRLASAIAEGRLEAPWEVAAKAGATLRQALGLPTASAEERLQVRSALPGEVETAREYAMGISHLRAYEPAQAVALLQKVVEREPLYAPGHAALALAFRMSGKIRQARATSERAFELSDGLPRAQRLRIEGRFYRDSSRWKEAENIYRALLTFFPDELDDGLALASVQTAGGEPSQAIETLNKLRKLPSPVGDDARIDLWESTASARLHDSARALAAAERALNKARARGASQLEGEAEELAAEALHRLGRIDEALSRYQNATERFQVAGHLSAQMLVEKARADVLADVGRESEAAVVYERVLPKFEALGDDYRVAGIQNRLGQVYANWGEVKKAHDAYQASVSIYEKLNDDEGVANVAFNRAGLFLADGALVEARQGFSTALGIYERLSIKAYVANTSGRLASVTWREGKLIDAVAQSEKAIAALREANDLFSLAYALMDHGLLLRDAASQASETYREAQQLFEKLGSNVDAAVARVRLKELMLDELSSLENREGTRLSQSDEEQLRSDLTLIQNAHRPAASLAARILARALYLADRSEEAQSALALEEPKFLPDRLEHQLLEIQLNPIPTRGSAGDFETLRAIRCDEPPMVKLMPLAFDCQLTLLQKMKPASAQRGLEKLVRDAESRGFWRIARAAKRHLNLTALPQASRNAASER